MSYVCVKPITLLGNNYKPGELIRDGHILPTRERALLRTGCIAEVTGATEFPVAELVQVETGEEVTFSVPVIQEIDGDTAQVMSVPLTEGDMQQVFAIMQMNADEAAKAIKDVKSENILVVLHATDSRVTVKRAAKSQAEELLLDDKAILTNDQAKQRTCQQKARKYQKRRSQQNTRKRPKHRQKGKVMPHEKTYTYNPEKIGEQGVDRMRFELGDTMVEGAEETSALSNEEYTAIIAAKKTWKRAKLAALESIMRRFGMEVNTTVGPLKLEMQARAEFWRKQYEQLKKSVEPTRYQRPEKLLRNRAQTEAIIFMVVCTIMCTQRRRGRARSFI